MAKRAMAHRREMLLQQCFWSWVAAYNQKLELRSMERAADEVGCLYRACKFHKVSHVAFCSFVANSFSDTAGVDGWLALMLLIAFE